MTSQPVTLTIERGTCRIEVFGRRSTKGWDLFQLDGGAEKHLGHRKLKDHAIRYAEDACEPGVKATFHIRPSQ